MIDCRIYMKTGYNAVNIPDGPSRLNTRQYVDVPALDIMQASFLKKIRVKAYLSQIEDGDYIRLTAEPSFSGFTYWYYTIDSINMTSEDVAELYITPDFLTTIGGVERLSVIDGVTERVCVDEEDDVYGRWDSYDPFLAPAAPLKTFGHWVGGSGGGNTFIETTLDPIKTGYSGNAVVYNNKVTPSQGEPYEVARAVPEAIPNPSATSFGIGGLTSESHGTTLYRHNSTATFLDKGIARLRGLGLEQSIISQYQIPNGMCSVGYASATFTPNHMSEITYQYVSNMSGVNTIVPLSGYAPLQFGWHNLASYDVKNKLLLYSSYTKYGMLTCSGARAEFIPADLYLEDQPMTAQPAVRMITDPHPDGRPYFRFNYVQGYSADTDNKNFWVNCVPGCNWKQVPLVFQGASGSVLNTMRYEANKERAANNYQRADFNAYHDIQKLKNQTAEAGLGGALGAIIGAVSGNAEGVGSGIGSMGNILHGAGDVYQATRDFDYFEKGYNLDRATDAMELAIANNVVSPELNIPYNSDVIRDVNGNGCFIYRYHYDYRDIRRIDKLLTMYGYKVTKALETSDFTNRPTFNFVQCSSVSVTGFSKWVNDGVAAQLRNGVRVWHDFVSPEAYNYGNKSNNESED